MVGFILWYILSLAKYANLCAIRETNFECEYFYVSLFQSASLSFDYCFVLLFGVNLFVFSKKTFHFLYYENWEQKINFEEKCEIKRRKWNMVETCINNPGYIRMYMKKKKSRASSLFVWFFFANIYKFVREKYNRIFH